MSYEYWNVNYLRRRWSDRSAQFLISVSEYAADYCVENLPPHPLRLPIVSITVSHHTKKQVNRRYRSR